LISLRVTEPEQRWHRIAEAADLRVDVHVAGLQLSVVPIDVIGLE
jgi:hypothetical protein